MTGQGEAQPHDAGEEEPGLDLYGLTPDLIGAIEQALDDGLLLLCRLIRLIFPASVCHLCTSSLQSVPSQRNSEEPPAKG